MNPKQEPAAKAKRNVALEAVKHVKDGFIVGLGSGSTAAFAIEEIGRKIKEEKIHVLSIPTSYQAFMLAVKHGIPITTLDEHPRLDLDIDGADQVDKKLDLIKGMGGALAREKIVASASKKLIIITDESKKVQTLGENGQPVPVEVLPFAVSLVARNIMELGGKPILREGAKKVGAVVTDNGNFILDVEFGLIRKPTELERKLKGLTGVVETGLFINMVDTVYVGTQSGVEALSKKTVG